MKTISFLFYRGLYAVLLMLLKPFRTFYPAKIQSYFQERIDHRPIQLPARPILIHAASGEIEYAKPLIRKLRAEYPQTPLVVTYTSTSIKKLVHDLDVDGLSPLPFDTATCCKKFLNQIQPKMILFSRTDVWPEFAYQARQSKIPSLLFSATFSAQSLRFKFPFYWLTSFAFDQLDHVSCVDQTDLDLVQSLPTKTTAEVGGDTRFDQVLYRLNSPKFSEEIFPQTHRDQVLVIGSSWPEDEEKLLPVAFDWVRSGKKIIWAPHEIEASHIEALRIAFKDQGLSNQTWSEVKAGKKLASSVILLDQVGALADLYKQGSIAFVGGSFKKRVHSVMEALAQDCKVLTGPFIQNNREAVNFSNVFFAGDCKMVTVCKTTEDLSQAMKALIVQNSNGQIRKKVESLSGATDRLFVRIQRLLEKSST